MLGNSVTIVKNLSKIMIVQVELTPQTSATTPAVPRPESLLLAFSGAHLAERHAAVAVSSVIGLLGRLGVSEHASRAALKRMTQRQLLRAIRAGRQAYVTLTPHAGTVLREGRARLAAGTVNRDWDGRWTLLAFSVPEDRREDRHALRTQLAWAGFGPLQNALWIAPSPGDVAGPLAAHGLLEYVKIFRAEAVTPGDPRLLAAEAWDLPGLARGYQGFLRSWDDPAARAPDELSRQVLLEAEWLLLIRADPRLPLALLPGDWPGVRAERVFRSLRQDLDAAARRLAGTLDWMPLP
jgi:DNA-binding transcriptional regulator PaaX